MVEAVLAAEVHDDGAGQHREEDGGDHGLFLAGWGQGAGEIGEAFAEGIGFLPLAHRRRMPGAVYRSGVFV